MNRILNVAQRKKIKISTIIRETRLSKSFIYDVIKERSSPSIVTAQKIAKSLDSSLDELFPIHVKQNVCSNCRNLSYQQDKERNEILEILVCGLSGDMIENADKESCEEWEENFAI